MLEMDRGISALPLSRAASCHPFLLSSHGSIASSFFHTDVFLPTITVTKKRQLFESLLDVIERLTRLNIDLSISVTILR